MIARADDELRREALIKRARLLEDGLDDTGARGRRRGARSCSRPTSGEHAGGRARVSRGGRRARAAVSARAAQWHDLVDLFEARLGARPTPTPRRPSCGSGSPSVLRERSSAISPAAIDQYEQRHRRERAVGARGRGARAARRPRRAPRAHRSSCSSRSIASRTGGRSSSSSSTRSSSTSTTRSIRSRRCTRSPSSTRSAAARSISRSRALARAWRIDVADDAALTKLLSLAGKLEAWDEAVAHRRGRRGVGAERRARGRAVGARRRDPRGAARRQRARDRRVAQGRRGAPRRSCSRSPRSIACSRSRAASPSSSRSSSGAPSSPRTPACGSCCSTASPRCTRRSSSDKPHAIAAYKNVLGVDDTDLAALDALERLYARTTGDAPRARRHARAQDRADQRRRRRARQLRHAAAQVYEHAARRRLPGDRPAHRDPRRRRRRADARSPSSIGSTRSRRCGPSCSTSSTGARCSRSSAQRPRRPRVPRRAARRDRADRSRRRDPALRRRAPGAAGARGRARRARAADAAATITSRRPTPILERVYRAEREARGPRSASTSAGSRSRGRDPAARRADWQALAEVRETIANQPAQAFVVWGARARRRARGRRPAAAAACGSPRAQNLWRELAALLDERLEDAHAAAARRRAGVRDAARRRSPRTGSTISIAPRARSIARRTAPSRAPRSPRSSACSRASNKLAELAAVLRRQADAAEDDAQTAEYLFRDGDLQETTLRDARARGRRVPRGARARADARAGARRARAHARDAPAEHAARHRRDPRAAVRAGRRCRAARRRVLEAQARGHRRSDRSRGDPAAARRARREQARRSRARARRGAALARGRSGVAAGARARPSGSPSGSASGARPRRASTTIVHAPDARDRAGRRPGRPARVPRPRPARAPRPARRRDRDVSRRARARARRARRARSADRDPAPARRLRARSPRRCASAARSRSDAAERRAAFAEVAQLCERAGDRAGAIAAWREIADDDDTDRDALDQLARIYRSRPATIATRARRRARRARRGSRASPDDEKPLRVEIAQLEGEAPRAVAAWQAVVDLDPEDLAALGQLEAAHARASDWIAVGDIQTRRLDLAKTTHEQGRDPRRDGAARRDAPQLGRRRDHRAGTRRSISTTRTSAATTSSSACSAPPSRWHDLVELLERRAELHATLGDGARRDPARSRAPPTSGKPSSTTPTPPARSSRRSSRASRARSPR